MLFYLTKRRYEAFKEAMESLPTESSQVVLDNLKALETEDEVRKYYLIEVTGAKIVIQNLMRLIGDSHLVPGR